jgi:hypothetical protein
MSKVRAKFKVTRRSELYQPGQFELELKPVTANSEENARFYLMTPCGEIKISTINEEAAKVFVVGKECYVDFIFDED